MMMTDDFQAKTDAFLIWLSTTGVVVSPKISLVDLRSENRGRGISEIFSPLQLYSIP